MGRMICGIYMLGILLSLGGNLQAQTQTVGLFTHLSGSDDDGYVLFAPQNSDTTYLIDKCGRLVHEWASDYTAGLDAYLLPDGSLLRAGNYPNPVFEAVQGSPGGIIERYDWDGNLVWKYVLSDSLQSQNHDIWYMPNGHILAAVWEVHSDSDALAQGRDPSILPASLWSAKIMELQPVGTDSAIVVWQWRAWDHLIQDYDSTRLNYGIVGGHPELLDINFTTGAGGPADPDWLHLNQVTYNSALDEIMISFHNLDEIYIIDHSTTTAQAASHNGGAHGRGGDFLYRWGNPMAYRRGGASDKRLFLQHDPEWISTGKFAGDIIIFNNGNGRTGGNASSVDIIEPPLDSTGGYSLSPGGAYTPASAVWSYMATPASSFYSAYEGSAQVIPNGDILICEALTGRLFEIDSEKNTNWDYVIPVNDTTPATQGSPVSKNFVYRCYFYPSGYPAFSGQVISASAPIERNPLPSSCVLDGVPNVEAANELKVFPNPASDELTISSAHPISALAIYDLPGHLLQTASPGLQQASLDVSGLPPGLYLLRVDGAVTKFVKE